MPISITQNIDCMDAMREFPDRFFELAIVDPPYNVEKANGYFGRGGKRSHQPSQYRKELKNYAMHNEAPNKEYFDELFRVSENQIIWGANYYPQFLKSSGWIVWDKKKKDGLMAQAELAFQSLNNVTRIFAFEWEGFRKGIGSFEASSNRIIHPNQKPLALYKWLLTNYAKPGDKILDTHLGSGSSRIAAYDLGFDFYGYELDAEYFEAQEARYTRHIAQPKLFEPVKNEVFQEKLLFL